MKLKLLRTRLLLLSLIFVLIGVCQPDAFAGRWVFTGGGWKWFEYCSIPAYRDTYVDSNDPGGSHGGEGDLYVGDAHYNEPAKITRTYMMFNLGSIPSGKPIMGAKLNLRSWGVGPNPKIVVGAHYLSDNTWLENITWISAPTTYNAAASDIQTVGSSANWYSWNVTSDAIAARSSGFLSEVLTSSTEGGHQWAAFSSKEESNSNFKPYLEVWYDPNGTIVPGGSEGFGTNSGNVEFGGNSSLPELPPELFGFGSLPFAGKIELEPEAPDPTTGVDTIINREAALLPNPDQSAPVPIELVELSLKSTEPIFVEGIDSFFDVSIKPDAITPSFGQMTVRMEIPGGGIFNYDYINTDLIFTFVYAGPLPEPPPGVYPTVDFPIPITIQSGFYHWEDTSKKENLVGGQDGFYPVGEDSLATELYFAGGICGELDLAPQQEVKPTLMVHSEEDWLLALERKRVVGVTHGEWSEFIGQYNANVQGANEPYPDETETTFVPPTLYVCGGSGGGGGGCFTDPCNAGMVMAWGSESDPDGEYASAFKYKYPFDPDDNLWIWADPPASQI